jgi:hypothetical protein
MNKNLMTVIAAASLALIPLAQAAANVTVNPSSVQIKVYQVMLSTSADCSSPISVSVNATPAYQEMTANPTLVSGNVALGTYKCIMMNINSLIKYTPATSDGSACVAGTQYQREVCRGGQGFAIPTGGTGTCPATSTSDTANNVPFWVYFSVTGTASSNSQPNGLGMYPNMPMLLGSPLVVTGSQSITFVMDFDGQITSDQDNNSDPIVCDCNPPAMSFR